MKPAADPLALPDCLPVPPQVRRVEVIEVTYCIQRRSDGCFHNHIALFDADTGHRYADICQLGGS